MKGMESNIKQHQYVFCQTSQKQLSGKRYCLYQSIMIINVSYVQVLTTQLIGRVKINYNNAVDAYVY